MESPHLFWPTDINKRPLKVKSSSYLYPVLPEKLYQKLEKRKAENAFRTLGSTNELVDFSSNDYLGFSRSFSILDSANSLLTSQHLRLNGATGSRLLSGNHSLYDTLETHLKSVHQTERALVFNSGYSANLGLIASVAQRGDLILFDELCHASIREAISMNNAKAYKFKHNDLKDLEASLHKFITSGDQEVYIITESVFSMDGDSPDLNAVVKLARAHHSHVIIDEAHALGVFNYGLVQELNLQDEVFARIVTFGKALGTHGAAVLGSEDLINYLINFSRPFIYTTGLPPHTVASILASYEQLRVKEHPNALKAVISVFKDTLIQFQLNHLFIESHSAIQCAIISGNEAVKQIAHQLQSKGFDVKPILSPTVPRGEERLRFCLHSYNSKEEISEVLSLLATFV